MLKYPIKAEDLIFKTVENVNQGENEITLIRFSLTLEKHCRYLRHHFLSILTMPVYGTIEDDQILTVNTVEKSTV
jgi:hypothetical protein